MALGVIVMLVASTRQDSIEYSFQEFKSLMDLELRTVRSWLPWVARPPV